LWQLFLGGLVLGACLTLAIGAGIVGVVRSSPSRPATAVVAVTLPPLTATPTLEPLASASRTEVPQPVGSPESPFQSRFTEAEDALYLQGDAQTALSLLVPLSKEVTTIEDLARVNEDLGNAEFVRGQFQRAAAYYEALFDYRPGPDSLYLVARAYDMGGDLKNARDAYLRLAAWPDELADPHRDEARMRADEILQIIGTPVP
jgi:tetratricopeptide (TPR) repeat protein